MRNFRFRDLFSFLAGIAIAFSCANSLVARAEFFSVGDPARVWTKKTLHVCWLNDPDVMTIATVLGAFSKPKIERTSETRRKTIRDLLEANYPEYLTGIKLADFVDCPSRGIEKFDVLVVDGFEFRNGLVNSGFSSIGDDHVASIEVGSFSYSIVGFNLESSRIVTGVKNDWFLAKLRKIGKNSATKRGDFASAYRAMAETLVQEHMRITLVHEFGHLFGLVHEDSRTDAPDPKDAPYCWTFSSAYHDETSTTAPVGGKKFELSRVGTPFDVFSIMNYCRHDLMDWYERARFLCAWAKPMNLESRVPSIDRPAMRRVLAQCPFIESNGFPIGITRGDRFGIRALYGRAQEDKPEDTDYRKSPVKMKWISIFADFAVQSWLDGDPVGEYLDALKEKKKASAAR